MSVHIRPGWLSKNHVLIEEKSQMSDKVINMLIRDAYNEDKISYDQAQLLDSIWGAICYSNVNEEGLNILHELTRPAPRR